MNAARRKPPFGIGQTGKSFPQRDHAGLHLPHPEFEQMEMEFFVKPGTDEQWHSTGCRTGGTGTSTSGSTRRTCVDEHPQEFVVPLLQAYGRHRVPVRVRGL